MRRAIQDVSEEATRAACLDDTTLLDWDEYDACADVDFSEVLA